MFFSEVSNCQSLVFFNALMQASSTCISDITCITQTTLKLYTTHCWFIRGSLPSFTPNAFLIFKLVQRGLISAFTLWLGSPTCLCNETNTKQTIGLNPHKVIGLDSPFKLTLHLIFFILSHHSIWSHFDVRDIVIRFEHCNICPNFYHFIFYYNLKMTLKRSIGFCFF